MAKSRLEINFVRLLSRCEAMASEKREEGEWRLEKFVCALEEMLDSIKKDNRKPAAELLVEYSRKVDFLKGLLEAEKLPSPSEKALANQFLAPGRTPTISKERTPVTKTVHLQTQARYTGEMRNELLGKGTLAANDFGDVYPRKRKGSVSDDKQSAAELDAVLQHHHNLQEKLAEEMLRLTQNLKNNTLAAQNVIKQDNQVHMNNKTRLQNSYFACIHQALVKPTVLWCYQEPTLTQVIQYLILRVIPHKTISFK
ncbi:hypothetical protein XENTR_v10001546 [Xenopus tropicalis]|nr:hypothetical protein XENTR_v10001546 [Xenopus tropicalis]